MSDDTLVSELEASARRWWVPMWLSDLLIRAASRIEVDAEMERLLRSRLAITTFQSEHNKRGTDDR